MSNAFSGHISTCLIFLGVLHVPHFADDRSKAKRFLKLTTELQQCRSAHLTAAYKSHTFTVSFDHTCMLFPSALDIICWRAADGGFLAINEFLQSAGGPANVFAAGDVATSVCDPRPKAGVFAVRQGLPLADNIRLYLTGQELKPFKPQKDFLGIISTGDRSAVATRGNFALSGDWLWKWKDYIDRKFMKKFSEDLPHMQSEAGVPSQSKHSSTHRFSSYS